MPENAKIIIKTDCINCITTFEKLNKQYLRLTHKKWLKINNWIIWSIIKNIIQGKNLQVTMVYVKAHSGEIGNERANTLAREAIKKVPITWKRLSDAWLDTTPK